MSMNEEEIASKRAVGIEVKRKDPWPYDWVAGELPSILELCALYPEYFPPEEGIKVISQYLLLTKDSISYIEPALWQKGLRQSVLNRLKTLCDKCELCELSKNRIAGRGSVFGDGKVDADLMFVGEGPGAYEETTEIPFVDSEALRSSTCASKCDHFEKCYIAKSGEWAKYIQRECNYTPVKITKERLAERLKRRTPGELATTGQMLGTALKKNRLFRQSYVQMLKMSEDVGIVEKGKYDIQSNVYITNAIRCRCIKRDDNGRIKDETPKIEHIKACNPWLEMTQVLVKPARLVSVGTIGLSALKPELPKGWKITQACDVKGTQTPTVRLANGKAAIVLLHPSYISRMLENAGRDTFDALLDKFSITLKEAKTLVAQEKETNDAKEATK